MHHAEPKPPKDLYGRPLRDLRISVTDRCNFRCPYCMPAEVFDDQFPFMDPKDFLDFDEIERLVRLFSRLGVKKVRLTGGEPLLRKDLPELVSRLSAVPGIEDIALTTNGSLLQKNAAKLKQAGLHRVTVSLDSLDDETFSRMNGIGYKVRPVLEGIETAAACGLPVKINMVVKKGCNERDILPMARYFREKGHTLRFIEYMDVGNDNGWRLDQVVASRDIVRTIHREMPLEPVEAAYFGEVAARYRYKGSNVEIGLISSVTQAFCASCTRARLSADGTLYTCLFATRGHDLRRPLRSGWTDAQIAEQIGSVWQARNDRYSEERQSGSASRKAQKIDMWYIGG